MREVGDRLAKRTPTLEGGPKRPVQFHTEQDIIRYVAEYLGRSLHPIATERFIGKSKDTYNEAWMVREIVQNFVDHNVEHPHTLDGVEHTATPGQDGMTRLDIVGHWAFKEATALLSPDSDKPETGETAGGNGIGLKQFALRAFRDFNAKKFEIVGEGWTVNYHLVTAVQLNTLLKDALKAQDDTIGDGIQEVRKDWLVGETAATPDQRGSCRYTIETNSASLLSQFDRFGEMGVSRDNPYLHEPNFENKKGAIKWLPPTADDKPAPGKLYVNGQAMLYGKTGDPAADYWHGPAGVALRLNDVKYKMSIDRPAFSGYDTQQLMTEFCRSMSVEQLLDQLRHSEHLWTGQEGINQFDAATPGGLVVVQKFVETLQYARGYDRATFNSHFPGRHYVAYDTSLSKRDLKTVTDQGLTICPKIFQNIGAEPASSHVIPETKPEPKREIIVPDVAGAERSRQQAAETVGIQVGAAELAPGASVADWIKALKQHAPELAVTVSTGEANNKLLTIALPHVDWSTELLAHPLITPKPKDATQQTLYLVRGLIRAGMMEHWIAPGSAISYANERLTSFDVVQDDTTGTASLFTRNRVGRPPSVTDGAVVQFQVEESLANKLARAGVAREVSGIEAIGGARSQALDERALYGQRLTPAEKRQAKIMAAAGVAVVAVLGLAGYGTWKFAEHIESARSAQAKKVDVPEVNVVEKVSKQSATVRESPVDPAAALKAAQDRLKDNAAAKRLAQQDPEIMQRLQELERLTAGFQAPADPNQATYEAWKYSDQARHLAEASHYIDSEGLLRIVDQYTSAPISSRRRESDQTDLSLLANRLEQVARRFADGESITHFEIVYTPTEQELAQLTLLSSYITEQLSVDMTSDLFLFKGEGAYGVNFQKEAIGLHESLLQGDFDSALRTTVHEYAHEYSMSHGEEFIKADGSIWARIHEATYDLAVKASHHQPLTPKEELLLQAKSNWDALRAVK